MEHDSYKSVLPPLLLDLSIEERLVIALSSGNTTDPAESGKSLLTEFQADSFDYDRFFNLAQKNGVIPLIYYYLQKNNLSPTGFLEKLRPVYLQTVALNLEKSQELIRVIQVLTDVGIEVIPLKGPVAAENIFGAIGLYPFSDIDVLVRAEDLPKADGILRYKAGYKALKEISSEVLRSDHYHYVYQNEKQSLEVHWNLVKRYYRIPEEFWWQGTSAGDFQGTAIIELENEKYLLYLIFRLFDHQFLPLRFLVLTAEFIKSRQDTINWQRLLDYAVKYRMKRLVWFVLKLVNDLLGVSIPDQYMKQRNLMYKPLSRLVVSGFFRESQKAHLRMLVYVTLLDSPLETLAVISKRVFPSKGEIRLRYGIGQDETFKTMLYYVMNPFLLIFRRR